MLAHTSGAKTIAYLYRLATQEFLLHVFNIKKKGIKVKMLPKSGLSAKGQSIHINPDFKSGVLQKLNNASNSILSFPLPSTTHINPLFMNTIHMNPQFLSKNIMQQATQIFPEAPPQNGQRNELPVKSESKSMEINKIISKSRTRLVRESHSQMKIQLKSKPSSSKPLLLLTKRKLIRAQISPALHSTSNNDIARRKQRNKVNKNCSLTRIVPILKRRSCAFVGQYALRRSNSVKKTIFPSDGSKKHKTTLDTSITSVNKQMRLVNINGILYKSTGNKLQRKIDNSCPTKTNQTKLGSSEILQSSLKLRGSISKSSKNTTGRTLYVRGSKYVMDPMGFKLTRVTQSASPSQFSMRELLPNSKSITTSSTLKNIPRRIDIGGVTYIACGKSKNVLLRTSTHLVLAHLNQAKQRSVHVLSRSLTKTNKPCLIFQRLGKCAALERNRCSKVHDKQRIIVCPKFLQGLCFNANCLLSHNKTLQKMPVCRFYLQGSCVRTDCPYLHKKLSDDSEICEDFRRGFCVLAEQCNKQHIFSRTKRKAIVAHESNELSTSTNETLTATDATIYRYFNGENFVLGVSDKEAARPDNCVVEESTTISDHNSDEDSEKELIEADSTDTNVGTNLKRKQIGTLPSFIPLS